VDRPENILFRTKDPSSDIVVADLAYASPEFSRWKHVSYVPYKFLCQTPRFHGEPLTSIAGSLGYVAADVLNQKGHSKLVDLWSIG